MNVERPEQSVDESPEDVQEDLHANEEQPADEPQEAVEPADALAAAETRADEHWDRYLRAAAELENVRKRASRDVENARKFALERFGKELLTVRDTLEMGLAAADNATAHALRRAPRPPTRGDDRSGAISETVPLNSCPGKAIVLT